jgi:predicted transcriptional regulator
MMALQKRGSGTATQISAITQRCRASESKNLNELHLMGVVSKQRLGRERVFKTKTAKDFGGNEQSFKPLDYERMNRWVKKPNT